MGKRERDHDHGTSYALDGMVSSAAAMRPVRVAVCGALLGVLTLAGIVSGLLEPLSFAITVGGAIGVVSLTFPRSRLLAAVLDVRTALAGEPDPEAQIAAMKRLARIHRLEGPRAAERAAHDEKDAFLRHAVVAAIDADDLDGLERQLVAEVRREVADIEESRLVLATLGKLFPAFGLIGTLIGLVCLLGNLGDGGLEPLAQGLGIAVQTTLYGALLANAVVLPLTTRLTAHAARHGLRLQMTLDGALLVARRAFPSQIDAVLRAHLGTSARERRHAVPLRLAERAA